VQIGTAVRMDMHWFVAMLEEGLCCVVSLEKGMGEWGNGGRRTAGQP
jgi:hypothetical protein